MRHARVGLGISQFELAGSVRTSQSRISRLEAGKIRTLSLIEASRVAAAVGLDLSIKAYPSERRPRDVAHLKRLKLLLENVGPPLRYRIEVPLPSTGPYPERRAWDAMVDGDGEETALELEVSLYDVQAQTRRIFIKQRDGRPDHLLVVVADTRANRRVLGESAELLRDLPILRRRDVIATLRAGRHPPTGIVLF